MIYIWILTIFAVTFEASFLKNSTFCHICHCKPSRRRATCSNLTYIPEIPKFVDSLVLEKNRFTNVTRQFLFSLHTKNLSSLSFNENSIHRLNADAFADLITLNELKISKEYYLSKVEVRNALNGLGSTRIRKVRLENNNWTNIPIDMLDSPTFGNVSLISLALNKFRNISLDLFAHLHVPFEIDLSRNKLSTFTITKPLYIKKLNLQDNDIVELPSFCTDRNISKVKNIEMISLNNNALPYISSVSFECLFSLKELCLDSNRFKEIKNNTFSGMNQLLSLSLQHNQQLKRIHPLAFNSSSLKKLHFMFNNFNFDSSYKSDAINIFRNAPCLERLDLTNNFLPNSDIALHQMFSPLRRLTYMNLHSTRLYKIPRNVFPHLNSLKTLILQGNYIRSWDGAVFDNMTNLEHLNIEGNYIRLINRSSIPFDELPRLKKLDLSNNPFSCICELMWFTNWIREINKTTLEILNFPQRYKCMYPDNMHGLFLVRYFPTEENCKPWNPLFTMAIIISSFGFLVLVVILTVYRCHTHLRNYLYLLRIHRRKRQGYLRLDSSDDFEYHAFVVYCDADREWVHSDLLRRLENEGLKLCIHHRDFDVGTGITENIDTYMNKCWKVVVVMSNAFARSDWCQWEVDFIQQRRRRQGKEALVLIMLKAINANHMTSPLRTLLATTPYLTYRNALGEDLFWQAVIECLRRPLTVPPMAV